MSTAAGRIICPRCGENNFSAQANCWKCQSPLHASVTPPPAVAPRMPQPAASAPLPPIGAAQAYVDPSVAFWSAIALAFFFPAVAVPVGIIFLMLDDRRRIEIGRITLIWGIVFSVLQFLFFAWLYSEALAQLRAFLPGAPSQISGASQPKLTDKVPPLMIPGEQPAPATDNIAFPEPPK